MNVGQILETHLGWSCSELGDQIREYIKNFEKQIEKIKDKLKEIYGKNYYDEVISNFPKSAGKWNFVEKLIQDIKK